MDARNAAKDGSFSLDVTTKRLVQLANAGVNKRSWSQEDAQMFLHLFGAELENHLERALKVFIGRKLS